MTEGSSNNDTPLPPVVDGSEPTALQIVWQNVWVRAVTYVFLTVLVVTVLWRLRGGYAFALQVGIIGFLIAYIAIFAVCSALLSALGMDILSAGSAVISSMSNVGPGLNTVGAVGNYHHMADAGKWLLSFCMLMGRLEFFTVLVLFSPSLWKR